jgi:SAM-dependent methyltransferase
MLRPFARHYDAIYADKDYDADIQTISAISKSEKWSKSRILEIGAGTGNHTVRLARLAEEVVAVEIDRDFAAVAREKIASLEGVQASLHDRPLEELPVGAFDGVVALFNVLNYVDPGHRREFVQDVSARLHSGAWFVADLWNAAAVLRDPPRRETRNKKNGTTVVTQIIDPALEATGVVSLKYEIEVLSGGVRECFTEELRVNLWPLGDLDAELVAAGFSTVEFWDWRRYPAPASSGSWRVWMRATRQ